MPEFMQTAYPAATNKKAGDRSPAFLKTLKKLLDRR